MRRGRALCLMVTWASLPLIAAGCFAAFNRVAVSPDGRTMYFSLNEEAGVKVTASSNLYALDTVTGELRALTDGEGCKTWCELSPDGEALLYMRAPAGFELPASLGGLGSGVPPVLLCLLDVSAGRSLQLTGIFEAYYWPVVVPGDRFCVLAIHHGVKDEPRLRMIGAAGPMDLPLPDRQAAMQGSVATARDRFAVAVAEQVKTNTSGEKDEPAEVNLRVYAVKLIHDAPDETAAGEGSTAPARPRFELTEAAKWQVRNPRAVELTFSPDGSLLAGLSLTKQDEKGWRTGFYRLDPAGKRPPKLLFEAPGAFGPQWTPDSQGVVYLRICRENSDWREVVLWRPGIKEPALLARLPGGSVDEVTRWRWTDDGRLQIYHLHDDGVRVVLVNPDGSGAEARQLPYRRLWALKELADLRRALGKVPMPKEEQLPEPLAKRLLEVRVPLTEALELVRARVEAIEKDARRWEPVPAVPAPAELPLLRGGSDPSILTTTRAASRPADADRGEASEAQ